MLSATPGTLVAVEAKPYNFVDSRTGERREGTAHKLYVVPDFEARPLEIRADANLYGQALGLGMGANIEVLIDISARDNRVVYTAKGLSLVSKNGAKASA
jgi:hypothetical protein